jgi:hypothetical protein
MGASFAIAAFENRNLNECNSTSSGLQLDRPTVTSLFGRWFSLNG